MNSYAKAFVGALLSSFAAAVPLVCVFVFMTLPSLNANQFDNEISLSIALLFLLSVVSINFFRLRKRCFLPAHALMSHLHASSDTLLVSTEEFRNSSELVYKSSCHQKESIQQISAAVAEMSVMIRSAREIVNLSSEISQKTVLSVFQGQQSAAKVTDAIESIAIMSSKKIKLLNGMKQNLRSMNAILSRISTKTNLIKELVVQSRLLAHKASVEASQAGEAGDGFAAIADEIAKLAELTADSSREITLILEKSRHLIEEILRRTDEQSLLIGFQHDEALAIGQASIRECSALLSALAIQAKQAELMSVGIIEVQKAQSIGSDEIIKGLDYLDSNAREHLKISSRNLALSAHVIDSIDDLVSVIDPSS